MERVSSRSKPAIEATFTCVILSAARTGVPGDPGFGSLGWALERSDQAQVEAGVPSNPGFGLRGGKDPEVAEISMLP